MKHGKRPTVRQRKILQQMGLNSDNWLISQDTASVMIVIHRYTGTVREVKKN